jgi:signal transduction histidine kinase
LINALENLTPENPSIETTDRVYYPGHELRWQNWTSTAIFDSDGRIVEYQAVGRDVTELRKAYDELEERVAERTAELAEANEQIKLMSFQLIRAEELERGRIASELHDQVGQSLLLAKLNLDLLTNDISTVHERKIATNISNLLASTIDDIRTLTFGLRLPLLETAGLDAALQWLCTRFLEDFRLKIDYSCNCSAFQISSEKRYSLFQAIRELLLNVAKHGKVDTAELKLQSGDGCLVVYVIDKGVGFNPGENGQKPSSKTSLGIFNVRQRIKQLGGSFEVVSAPGKGTIAYISVPLDR